MKYYNLLILLLCLAFSTNAQADVCAYVSKEISQKAVSILENQPSVIRFCSTCTNDKPQTLSVQMIVSKDVPDSNYKQIYINDIPIDLAHIFIYLSEKKQYENLALAINCPEAEENKNLLLVSFTDVASLKEKQNPCLDNDIRCLQDTARKRYQQIQKLCREQTTLSQDTTLDMQKSAYNCIACIADELKKELAEVFDEKTIQSAEQVLEQIVKDANLFYSLLYSENKFCIPSCGTMATLFPPTKTENILQQLYETTIILKLKKGS